MRKILLAVVMATTVLIGAAEASLAATPQSPAVTVRQTTISPGPFVETPLDSDPDLSNHEDHSGDD
jgi:hypothetical protein